VKAARFPTSPLEGEVAASLRTRRVGGMVFDCDFRLTPHPLRKRSDLPLKGGGQKQITGGVA
jgi:hypothetical protein